MRFFLILFFLFFFAIYVPSCAFARELSIIANKSSLFFDEEAVIIASASGFTAGEQIFIKGAFFKEGTSNYFGFTKNNNEWIKNSAPTASQRSIKIGEWDLNLTVKNDSFDTGYKGNGVYKFKLGYYYMTSGGNLSPVNWSTNILDFSLTYPTPTLTPTFSPTQVPSPSSTPTPIPTKVLLQTPTIVRASVNLETKKTYKNKGKTVLGAADLKKNNPSPLADHTAEAVTSPSGFVAPPLFLLLGILIIITGCGILLFQEWKKQKELEI